MKVAASSLTIRESVIVFDIGGTWFRSGILLSSGRLIEVTKIPAINYKNYPHEGVSELQTSLVKYLIEEARRLRSKFSEMHLRIVGVSMGAALNAHTHLILNSGPLWGPKCKPFDLAKNLIKKDSSFIWSILNDISAALLRYIAAVDCARYSKINLITVSTGIGARTYDTRTQAIPIDPLCGIQGEIGHIPIEFTLHDTRVEGVCDCGGKNHLNAFCSGRGIESLLSFAPQKLPRVLKSGVFYDSIKTGAPLPFLVFAKAVKHRQAWARDFLDAVTLPLARLLITAFTFDPEIDLIFLTGGVVNTLGENYRRSLLKNLNMIGLYQITKRDHSYFETRIRHGIPDDNSGLIGVGLYTRTQYPYASQYV